MKSKEKDVINIMTFHSLTFGSTFYYWSKIAPAISHIKVFFIVNHFMTSYHITIHSSVPFFRILSTISFCVIFLHKGERDNGKAFWIWNWNTIHQVNRESMQGKESWIFNLELISLGIMLALCNPFYYYVRGQVFSLSWWTLTFLMEFKFNLLAVFVNTQHQQLLSIIICSCFMEE